MRLVRAALLSALARGAAGDEAHDYCIVGAGLAGVQLAHFMEDAGRSYVLLERGEAAGSFFRKFPIHRNLISTPPPASAPEPSRAQQAREALARTLARLEGRAARPLAFELQQILFDCSEAERFSAWAAPLPPPFRPPSANSAASAAAAPAKPKPTPPRQPHARSAAKFDFYNANDNVPGTRARRN